MIGQRQAIEGPVVILFLSRIVSVKGVYQAIEAFALVNAKYPTTQLIIAGDGNELENVKSLLKSRHLDQAKTLGYVQGDEKRATFCESHIYVFPSQEAEGMPQSVLEAIGCGLPLVTTVLGGLTDFFLDGKMGLALSNVDPKHIADLLLKLVEDRVLRKEMALFNHRFARQHFLASKAAVRLEEIFTSVLAE
jgi:glycosyltransferase involved in cell wall biosynthesis